MLRKKKAAVKAQEAKDTKDAKNPKEENEESVPVEVLYSMLFGSEIKMRGKTYCYKAED